MRTRGEARAEGRGAAWGGALPRNLAKTLAKVLALALALGLGLFLAPAGADHDSDRAKDHAKERMKEREKHGARERLAHAGPEAPAGTAETYAKECGACHHAYYPGLLPARSWEKLLADPRDHFGEQLPLASQALAQVRAYLAATAADVAGNKRSRKIMADLGSARPMRITDIGYLRAKHRKLPQEVWARPAVGGFNNCNACHKGASAGDFDDDSAVIPN